MKHEGTKHEHATVETVIDLRSPFNYCPLCKGWYPRQGAQDGTAQQGKPTEQRTNCVVCDKPLPEDQTHAHLQCQLAVEQAAIQYVLEKFC